MEKHYSIYRGWFANYAGDRYGVEILYPTPSEYVDEKIRLGHSGETNIGNEETIRLSAEPALISYDSDNKLSPIVQSSCKIELLSDTDSRFHHLYSMDGRDVFLTIYRLDDITVFDSETSSISTSFDTPVEVIWRGAIDPEQYEEPYSRDKNYFVSLTFSDFGILKRQKVGLSGLVSIKSVVQDAIASVLPVYGLSEALRVSVDISTTMIGEKGEDLPLIDSAYIDSSIFYKDNEAMSYWDALEGVLGSLRLKLEQRRGKCYLYDHNALARRSATMLHSSATDAQFMADAVYNNIEVKTEQRLSDVDHKEELSLSSDIQFNNVPRTDVDGYIAYQERAESIGGGAYKLETKKVTAGEDATMIALYLDPPSTQGIDSKEGGFKYAKEVVQSGIRMDVNGSHPTYSKTYDSPIHLCNPYIPKRLLAYTPVYTHWSDRKRIFGGVPQTIVHSFSWALPRVDWRDYHLYLGAELFVGLGRSIYQRDDEQSTYDRRKPEERQKYWDMHQAVIFARIVTQDVRGKSVEYLTAVIADNGDIDYRWGKLNQGETAEFVPIQYGYPSLSANQWISPNERAKGVRNKMQGGYYGKELGDLVPPVPVMSVGGILLPIPEDKDSNSVFVEIAGEMSLEFRLPTKYNKDSWVEITTVDRFWFFDDWESIPKSRLIHEAIKIGVTAPNYVLLRNIKCGITRKGGIKSKVDAIETFAYINKDAYEPYSADLMLTSSSKAEQYSPALLRTSNGMPYTKLLRTIGSQVYEDSLHRLFAVSVVSMYGDRGHIVSGTFVERNELSPFIYNGKIYMRIAEELDLKKGRSKMTLSSLRQDYRRPEFYERKKGADGLEQAVIGLQRDLVAFEIRAKEEEASRNKESDDIRRKVDESEGKTKGELRNELKEAKILLEGLIKDSSLSVEYSEDGRTGWHAGGKATDRYLRQRVGEDGVWSEAIRIAGEDAILVQVWSNSGDTFANGKVETELVAFVYRGAEDISDTIPAGAYSWERISSNPDTDRVWTSLHNGIGRRLQLNAEDVVRRANFNVIVDID